MLPGWTCTDPNSLSTCTENCGDGRVVGNETCDDDDQDDRGCNSTCRGVLDGWECTGGNSTSPSICNPKCKDGLAIENEACDDGPNGHCNANCTDPQQGWQCPNKTSCSEICGDGLVVGTDICDNGLGGSNGCLSNCTGALPGYVCNLGTGPTVCNLCGNGKREVNETCDDG